MRAPICRMCLSDEKLCPGCEGKLARGEISKSDIELAKAMAVVSEKHPAMEKAEFMKTHGIDDLLVVVVPKGSAGQFIGRKGFLIKEVSAHMKKKIKVVEETNDHKEFVQRVLYPAKLRTLSVSGEQEKKYKVRIPSMDKNRIVEQNAMEKLFGKVLGGETSIIFE